VSRTRDWQEREQQRTAQEQQRQSTGLTCRRIRTGATSQAQALSEEGRYP
jgi:hypothetical protein